MVISEIGVIGIIRLNRIILLLPEVDAIRRIIHSVSFQLGILLASCVQLRIFKHVAACIGANQSHGNVAGEH